MWRGFSGVRERDGAKRCTCRRATGLQRQERVAGLGAASSGDGSGRLMCSALYWLCPAHPPDLGALLVLSPGRSVCRKVESFDAEKAGTVELESAEERDKRAADPFAKLEHGGEDKQRALATFTQITALQEESGAKHRCAASKVVHQSATRPRVCRCCHASEWRCLCVKRQRGSATACRRLHSVQELLQRCAEFLARTSPIKHRRLAHLDSSLMNCRDDYAINKQLRRQMRGVRKEEQSRDARRRELGLPEHVRLLPEAPGDALRASAQSYGGDFGGSWKHSRRAIGQQSIFSQGAVAAAARGSGSGSAGQKKRPAGSSSSAAQKQRRLAPSVKLRLSEPKKG